MGSNHQKGQHRRYSKLLRRGADKASPAKSERRKDKAIRRRIAITGVALIESEDRVGTSNERRWQKDKRIPEVASCIKEFISACTRLEELAFA